MHVLIIGGNGFIGSHVLDELLAAGHSVVVYDRAPERFRKPLPDVHYIHGSLDDTRTLSEALGGVSAVLHLASTTVPGTSNMDPVGDVTENLLATIRLLHIMRSSGAQRIVYLSSGGTVYGIPETDLIHENHPLRPISSYGIVKVAIENYLRLETHLHGLQSIVLRPSNPYGPRQGHLGVQGLIGTLMWRVAKGETIEIWGDGSVTRDYLHVRDLARLCRLAVESDKEGIFNAGSGIGHSVKDIVDLTGKVTGYDMNVVSKPGRKFDVPKTILDSGAAQKAFGWKPRIEIEAGLRSTWEWVKKQA